MILTPFERINEKIYTREPNLHIITPQELVLRELTTSNLVRYKEFINQVIGGCKAYYQEQYKDMIDCLEGEEPSITLEEINSLNASIDAFNSQVLEFIKRIDVPETLQNKTALEAMIQNLDKDFNSIRDEFVTERIEELFPEINEVNTDDFCIEDLIYYMDDDYLAFLVAQQFFNIFINLCYSVLKAEYLFDDKLSKEKIVPLLKSLKQKQEEDLSQEYLFKIGDEKMDCYLDDVKYLCNQYYNFNRRIDNAIDDNINAVLRLVLDENVGDELTLFKLGVSTLEVNGIHPQYLVKISHMFLYFFRYVLEMTYIDHNFAVGEKELNSLLILRTLLTKIDKVVMEKLEEAEYMDQTIKKQLREVLQLIELKNNYLIYKIQQSDKLRKLENYTYIEEGEVITFNKDIEASQKLGATYCLNKDTLLGKYGGENVLLEQSKDYVNILIKKKHLSNPNVFTDYERLFLKLISWRGETAELDNDFEALKEMCQTWENQWTEGHKDIFLYNQKIVSHIEAQFIKYGRFVKSLPRSSKEEDCRGYVQKLLSFLNEDKENYVFSCSFIIKHLEWVLKELKDVSSKKDLGKYGFELRTLADWLLNAFENLLMSIEDNTYCINFASLYQDSFYRITWGKNEEEGMVCKKIARECIGESDLKKALFDAEKSGEVIFLASTWLKPVGKIALKEYYKKLKLERDKVVTEFDSFYTRTAQEKITQQQNTLQAEINQNRHNVVQTLGIFAAFLALATVSVGGFVQAHTPFEFFQIIGGITACLIVFVLLIQLIVMNKANQERRHQYSLMITMFIILCVLIGALFYSTFYSSRETRKKDPEKTEKPEAPVSSTPMP